MKKTALVCNGQRIEDVYGMGRRQRLAALSDLYPQVVSENTFDEHAAGLAEVEAIFSTWGMWPLSAEQLARLPALKFLFYAAGSVQAIAPPLHARGIRVVSGWGANAVPVAEFTYAQILLSNKGYFRNTRSLHDTRKREGAFYGPGNFSVTVAILGAGQVGRAVIRLLKNSALDVLVWDPFLSPQQAAALGVEKVDSLAGAFARAAVVSNHLANVPATRGLITGALIESMPAQATFINTGRGATVVERELIAALRRRPDLVALLDVTDPEPAAPDSPLFDLPNAWLSTHIAGASGHEVVRMADAMIEEFSAWEKGEHLRYEVTAGMLAQMA